MKNMSVSRKRVFDAIEFRKPDKVPIEHHPSLRGYFEYGEKMRYLFKKYPGDFGDVSDLPIPVIPEHAYDENGEYYEEKVDEWGIKWMYRIFQIQGHPLYRPLDDIEKVDSYEFPPPLYNTPNFKEEISLHKQKYFTMKDMITILERMCALRLFEDVLMDMHANTAGINKMADRLVDYYMGAIDRLIEADVDCVAFGDDFGTQTNLLLSPETFRNFLKPRYKKMIDRVKAAGKKVHFHSCGANTGILEELADLGIDSYWPQLSAYNIQELADFTKSKKIAVALHFRGELMNFGTPEQIRKEVEKTAQIFDVENGGGWFYIEVDDGFPYENTKALFEVVDDIR